MGYDFAQAVADVVDNSIEASATLVAIDVEFDGDDSWVRIADNGSGMTPEQLREAMRYGAERHYDDEDLGKFGLGLKTASMSQCQCLSVASRWNTDRADIAAYSWDLAHIDKTNRWEILPLERNGLAPAIRNPLRDTTGTVVLWQRLDRILGLKHPYGEVARKRLFQMCRDVEIHMAMLFQRFLLPKGGRRALKLMVNGNEVKPWDPFCESEPKTKKLDRVSLPVEHDGVTGEVILQPYVLPHQDDFSSPEAFRAASGPANWNQQQGFYIYRASRMIQSGGWSNLRAPDEHTKLARISLSFPPKLDEAFKINVAKMRVQMPAQIRDAVREAIGPVVKLARETYGRKSGVGGPTTVRSNTAAPEGASRRSETTGKLTSAPGQPSNVKVGDEGLLTLNAWCERALEVAMPGEAPAIRAVVTRLRKQTPFQVGA